MALYTVTTSNSLAALDLNQLYNLLNGIDTSTAVTINNRIQAFTPGASFPAGYVGGTGGGPPSTGTFQVGDFVVDSVQGCMWVCGVAGSPGTWYRNGAGNYACVATSTTAQTLTVRSGQSGFDKIMLNAVLSNSDPHSMFRLVSNNIQVPLTGTYLVTGAFGTTLASTTFSQAAVLTKNGSIISRGDEYRVFNGGNCTASDLISCTALDTISLGAYAEAAAAINTAAGVNMLSVCLIA